MGSFCLDYFIIIIIIISSLMPSYGNMPTDRDNSPIASFRKFCTSLPFFDGAVKWCVCHFVGVALQNQGQMVTSLVSFCKVEDLRVFVPCLSIRMSRPPSSVLRLQMFFDWTCHIHRVRCELGSHIHFPNTVNNETHSYFYTRQKSWIKRANPLDQSWYSVLSTEYLV